MPQPRKIVLHCPRGYDPRLDTLVEDFIRDGVCLVAVVGEDCERIEDMIDELVVGDGSRDYDLLTSSQPGESLAAAIAFVEGLMLQFAGPEVGVIEL
jgi:hypothetical protein